MSNNRQLRGARILCCATEGFPAGPRGIQGEAGAIGPTGPTGPTGPGVVLAYGGFYNTCPVDIAPCCIIPITCTMMSAIPLGVALFNCNILINEPGLYHILYTVYTRGLATVGLQLCDCFVPGSIVSGENLVHGQVIITTMQCHMPLRLINAGDNTISLASRGTTASNVLVTVLRIA